MDPKKTYHYTGTQLYCKQVTIKCTYDSTAQSFCPLLFSTYSFTDIAGMTKECLELIFSEVKEKSERMNMWKGSRKTKSGKIQDKYLKVIIVRCHTCIYIFCLLLKQDFAIMYCYRNNS